MSLAIVSMAFSLLVSDAVVSFQTNHKESRLTFAFTFPKKDRIKKRIKLVLKNTSNKVSQMRKNILD